MAPESSDHRFTLVVGTAVAVLSYFALSMPWYYALIAAMIVSGLTEFAIKEVPPDTDDYDPKQYQLWAAADGKKTTASAETEPAEPIKQLRERYARGELDDEEFEQKVEKLLETDGTDETERELLTEEH
jgi:hypothetical protein